ncbi:MAG: cob(I)yrinic acid a,c-diamide adenosyltransferase [Acidimicrobiia bacterium]
MEGTLKVYTRTGDDGTTGLFYGGRASKDGVGPSAYGTVDEAVAVLGLARAYSNDEETVALLIRLQRELFVVGAELATAPENRHKLKDAETRTTAAMTSALETVIDDLNDRMEMPTEFVLPGQTPCGAALDIARAVVRRAERECVTATREAWLEPGSSVVPYLNRLADLLWVISRYAEGSWIPRRPESKTT